MAPMHPSPANHQVTRILRPTRNRNSTLSYLVAVVVTGVALLLALGFAPPDRPYYFFVGALAIATWFGGALPGLLATLLGVACGYLFVFSPQHRMNEPGALAVFMGFVAVSGMVYGLAAALYRTRAALHRSHLNFGGVVQISEDAIISIDARQHITLFNPGAEKIFGYTAEQALGKPITLLLPDRYRAMHEGHVREFAGAADALRPMNDRGTIFGRRADGAEFPAEASISKFEAQGEKIMTVRLRDVSERHASEQRLRQLAAIVESSQDAIISEDLNGVIVSWNPGAEQMYGYTSEEAIGRNARILLPSGAADEVTVNVSRAAAGESATAETVRMRKDGQKMDVALTVSPIRDRHGKVTAVATIARDITERKRLEEQLLHSQKMEAVGRLAGGIAHDFNNLLSIIVGYAYLIQSSSPAGEPIRGAADEIMTASEKAGNLTRQLLAFSRKQVLRPEVIDLNEVTGAMHKMLPRLLGEDIDVRLVKGADLRRIKADPGQVEQVVMNLVVNARDAMPGGGKLTIETANQHFDEADARQHNVRPGNYVMLAVSDTGHGMDAATRNRIFEPFFTTKESGKGTGLGLATVYGIVNQSNGHVWVYSELGQGTTFKIYFPATEAEVKARAAKAPTLSACGSETVLLVEDELQLRELLSHVLRDQGYKVLVAANGPEALRIAEKNLERIDLLLTDVVMPEMRGQELAERLQQRSPQLAVIYMSGYTDNALIHSGTLPQGNYFLQKPFTPDTVLRRIREVLDDISARRRSHLKAV